MGRFWHPDPEEEKSRYETALVCANGHEITSSLEVAPERRAAFCSRCGERTIHTCEGCGAGIRGHYHVPGFVGGYDYEVPRFCHACGKPYPWTSSAVSAAQSFTAELVGLTEQERQTLASTFPDLVRDTPQTQVAVARFKRLAAKAGPAAAEGLKGVLSNVVSEAVKRLLFS